MEVTINVSKTTLNFENEKKTNIELGASHTENLLANDYNTLKNQPSIEGVKLINDKTFEDLGLSEVDNIEIDKLFKEYFGI